MTWTEQGRTREAIRLTQAGEIRCTEDGKTRIAVTSQDHAWPDKAQASQSWNVQGQKSQSWADQ